MKNAPEFHVDPAVPAWRTVEDARRVLHETIDGFIAAAAERDADSAEPAAVLALRVTAGAGKTSSTLRALAKRAGDLLRRSHVLVDLPTLDLAERAAGEFQEIAPDVPCAVIRGRQASQPGQPGKRMCARHELAERVAGIVPSVTEALCRAEREDGTLWEAPCASACPYLAQRDLKGARIVFLPHAYLRARPPIDRDFPVVLRVIDEKVWPTLSKTHEISLEDFMRAPTVAFPHVLREALANAKFAIVEALQRNAPLNVHLRNAGSTATTLGNLAEAEAASRERPDIRPWHAEDTVHRKLKGFDVESLRASLTRQAIFSTLAEADADHCNRISFGEEFRAGETRQIIKFHKATSLPREAPILLLDADADQAITERLAPGAAFDAVDIKPTAEVVQVEDRTLSNAWLLDGEKGPRRRRMVLDLIAREVAQAERRGVLVVGSKAVLVRLHADAGRPVEDEERDLLKPLLGAHSRWFGPRMHGVNDFESFATVVIIGRLQPPPIDVEDAARCIFGDDAGPLIVHANGPLPESDTLRLMHNDGLADATFHSHPDPRALTMLRQMRECQSLQAIARLRLVAPQQPKRVVVLGNLPLPGLPVGRLISFEAVCRGLEADPYPRGFLRLETALRATMGGPVRGARLSAAGLAADLPHDFRSESVAREFRRGRTTPDMVALVQRIAAMNDWP